MRAESRGAVRRGVRLAGAAAAAAVLLSAALSSSPVAAQTRAAPQATQHVLDEQANALAQGKITRTPTPTPSTTATPVPTPVPNPTAALPSATPVPTSMAPEPPLPVPGVGQAVSAYVRSSPRDPSGIWLELALPQGRWAILYDDTLCTPPAAWTNVWLALDDQSGRPFTADRDDATAMCLVTQWSWTSDEPCVADAQGTCDVFLDGAYLNTVGQLEPTATDTPIPIPTSTPPLTPTPQPPIAPAAAGRPVEIVVQTVVVIVTAVPLPTQIPTQIATRTAVPTSTPHPPPTATATPLPTNTPTLEPTSTEVPSIVADVFATQVPTSVVASDASPPPPTSWNWPLTFAVLAVVLGLLVIWLFVLRSGPVMW